MQFSENVESLASSLERLLDDLAVGLVVQQNQVAAAHVETREMVDCVLRVEYVFVDDEGSALRIGLVAPSDLVNRPKLTKDRIELLR